MVQYIVLADKVSPAFRNEINFKMDRDSNTHGGTHTIVAITTIY